MTVKDSYSTSSFVRFKPLKLLQTLLQCVLILPYIYVFIEKERHKLPVSINF